ncbi:hypothetical protein YC2023_009696 [Brassica napus]
MVGAMRCLWQGFHPFAPAFVSFGLKQCNRPTKVATIRSNHHNHSAITITSHTNHHDPSPKASQPFTHALSHPRPSLTRPNLALPTHHPTTAHRTTLDPAWTAHYCHNLTQPPQLLELASWSSSWSSWSASWQEMTTLH